MPLNNQPEESKDLLALRRRMEMVGFQAAIKALEEFVVISEQTEWINNTMKRATIAGIKASVMRLRNEAAKR